MKKSTREWWSWRYNDCAEAELSTAIRNIGSIVKITGHWNFNASILEVDCGLAVLQHFLHDKGFSNVYGVEGNYDVQEFWEDHMLEYLYDNFDFPEDTFDLVCWFNMYDTPEEDWEDILVEIDRVGKKDILLKPFKEFKKEKDEEFLAFMMRFGYRCVEITPVLWNYHFVKD